MRLLKTLIFCLKLDSLNLKKNTAHQGPPSNSSEVNLKFRRKLCLTTGTLGTKPPHLSQQAIWTSEPFSLGVSKVFIQKTVDKSNIMCNLLGSRTANDKLTRRERPKSASYLRLKNIQGTIIEIFGIFFNIW